MEAYLMAIDDHLMAIEPDQMSGVKVLKSSDRALKPIVNARKSSAEIRESFSPTGTVDRFSWHGCHSRLDSLIFVEGFKTGLLGDDCWSFAPGIP
jgi:hypothetical protein